MKLNKKKWLFIAPHFKFPAKNGADILVERNAKELSLYIEEIDLLGCNEIITYSKGEIVSRYHFKNTLRPKIIAALRTVFLKSHYLYEKFITKNFTKMLNDLILVREYDNILYSYITTLNIKFNFPVFNKNRFIYTHNDEFEWFETLNHNTKNIFLKYICDISTSSLKTIFKKNMNSVYFIHVSEQDKIGFEKYYPTHRGIVSSVGADLSFNEILLENNNLSESKIILTFVGSLNVKINYDALLHFRRIFYPKLKDEFKDKLVIRVIGSSPTPNVIELCKNNQWEIFRDVSDEVLSKLLLESTYGLLPFSYSTGAKLKQLTYLSHGLPFLSTDCISLPESEIPIYCIASNNPDHWVKQIVLYEKNKVNRITISDSLKLYSQKYSWRNIVYKLVTDLEKI